MSKADVGWMIAPNAEVLRAMIPAAYEESDDTPYLIMQNPLGGVFVVNYATLLEVVNGVMAVMNARSDSELQETTKDDERQEDLGDDGRGEDDPVHGASE